jgi:hypothetical protein
LPSAPCNVLAQHLASLSLLQSKKHACLSNELSHSKPHIMEGEVAAKLTAAIASDNEALGLRCDVPKILFIFQTSSAKNGKFLPVMPDEGNRRVVGIERAP